MVLAVTEYLAAHPEALSAGQKLRIIVKPSLGREQIREMIVALLEERISGKITPLLRAEGNDGDAAPVVIEQAMQPDIEAMLDNLNLFGNL